MKSMKIWLAVLFSVVLATSLAVAAPAVVYSQDSGPQGETQTRSELFTDVGPIYAPLIARSYCAGAAPSAFSLQIAGLSDVTVESGAGSSLDAASLEAERARQMAELDEAFPTLVQALRESGAGWARVYVDWSFIEPTKGNYNWAWYDEKLAMVASSGVKILATIANPPQWAWVQSTAPCDNSVLNPQNYYDFLSAVVNRYRGYRYLSPVVNATIQVHTWELLNEPDAIPGYRCGTGVVTYGYRGDDYATLAEGASAVIKGIDPNAKVVMGGIAYDWFVGEASDGKFVRGFVDELMATTSGAGLDALNFHYFRDFRGEWERWSVSNDPNLPWAQPDPPVCSNISQTFPVDGLDVSAKLTYFKNRMSVCYGVNKPVWISEVGHHGTDTPPVGQPPENYDLDNQARYVFTVHARAFAHGAENVTWYALKIVNSITSQDYQGLVDENNNPKKAFWAYQTLTRELDGYRYASTRDWGQTVEAYTFSHPCQAEKIMAWVNADRFTGVLTPVNINVPANRLRLVYRPDVDGQNNPVDQIVTINDGAAGDLDGVVNGSVRFSLGLEPVIIQVNP